MNPALFSACLNAAGAGERSLLPVEEEPRKRAAPHRRCAYVLNQKYMLAVRCKSELATGTVKPTFLRFRTSHQFLAVDHHHHFAAQPTAIGIPLAIRAEGDLHFGRGVDLAAQDFIEL